MNTRPRVHHVLGAVLVVQLLVAGCGSGGGADSTAPSGTLSGTWVGRASGTETADFTLALAQSGSSVTGSGNVFFPGDRNQFSLDVAGSTTGESVELTIRVASRGSPVTYVGKRDGPVIRGRLTGGNIQHDGPFTDTPLELARQ